MTASLRTASAIELYPNRVPNCTLPRADGALCIFSGPALKVPTAINIEMCILQGRVVPLRILSLT
jgi:hypothetical protein